MSRRHGRRHGRVRLLFLWILCFFSGVYLALAGWREPATQWHTLANGMAYCKFRIPANDEGGHALLHVIRLDPAQYRIRLVHAGASGTATARQMALSHHALAVVNGGFFDENFKPLGLRVSGGRALRPLRRADWGVFLVRDGKPSIVHSRDYYSQGVTEAVQCGPRLVADGRVTRLKPQTARRTCIGIDGSGHVLLIVTEGADVDARCLARVLRAPTSERGLGCRNALNLDGGPSSQLYAAVNGFHLDLPGTWGVPDGVAIFRR